MMNSLRKLNSSWQNCRNDTSLARMWQHKSSNPCLAIRGKIRINETIPAHHNEKCETKTLCQFQHCSIFNISSIKLNGSASLTHFSLTSPKERCACNGSILLETCCRMIIRKKTLNFTSISYALEEICAAEEAYSLIHLALHDTHHVWHWKPSRSKVRSANLIIIIASWTQVGCPQPQSYHPSSSQKLNCNWWQPEFLQSPACHPVLTHLQIVIEATQSAIMGCSDIVLQDYAELNTGGGSIHVNLITFTIYHWAITSLQ